VADAGSVAAVVDMVEAAAVDVIVEIAAEAEIVAAANVASVTDPLLFFFARRGACARTDF
jgi:hypothetical protein